MLQRLQAMILHGKTKRYSALIFFLRYEDEILFGHQIKDNKGVIVEERGRIFEQEWKAKHDLEHRAFSDVDYFLYQKN